ncbi:MAG: H+/Na+-translocating ferredoxin:NAD+ oxidoreductase subunit [Pseudomonadota bacterium]|nr:H+/Na+-translocating ferredoxin:NAD+ oxidoreductase subunit [Pseudomonadota bacterium]
MLQISIEQIDAVLPQTQCTRCGYPSCRDYAAAIIKDEAQINQCPPGGDEGIIKLAALLNKSVVPLNTQHGEIKHRQIAIIEEEKCIGCTLCIKACPVDAIVGTNKMMHTVISDHCTGCDLCVPACPVDCIIMVNAENDTWSKEQADLSRARFQNRGQRKQAEIAAREFRLKQQAELLTK